MGKSVKKVLCFVPSIILSAIISFMFFIHEPITLYANNINDFWFDFYIFIGPAFLAFLICFAAITLFLLLFFIISHFSHKPALYYFAFLATFAAFLITYIHGNFMNQALPSLNGETIEWQNFTTEKIISVVICIIVIAVLAFTVYKFKFKNVTRYATYVSLVIFGMLAVSLVSTLATTDALKPKAVLTYATTDNINTYSDNQNFLILLLDAVDSARFVKATKNNPLYKETFKDFTYYPDTVGAYNLTRDSIPFIFSGKWDYNETDFVTYSTDAFNSSPFFAELESNQYMMNFYENEYDWHDRKAFAFSNITSHDKNLNKTAFVKNIIRYDLFKYAPWFLKSHVGYERIDFLATQATDERPNFDWGDLVNYQNITENSPETTDQKLFQFLHLEGAHVPYNLDSDLKSTKDGTYEEKCIATLKIINAYIERLRDNNLYDNSVIIVMADHGVNYVANPNPILYIKGIKENHSLQTSDKAVWYPDLLKAFSELLAGKSSSELFSEITEHRDRYIIQIPYQHEEHMIEWVQTGNAWDPTTLKQTGKEYDL